MQYSMFTAFLDAYPHPEFIVSAQLELIEGFDVVTIFKDAVPWYVCGVCAPGMALRRKVREGKGTVCV